MSINVVRRCLDNVLSSIVILSMLWLVLVVLWQVVSRFILKTPSTMTDEAACFLMICIALLGGAYTVGQCKHLAIDLLTDKLSGRFRFYAGLFYHLVVGGFALVVMMAGGFWLSEHVFSMGQVSPATGIPAGYFYWVLPLAGLFIVLYSGLSLIELCLADYRENS